MIKQEPYDATLDKLVEVANEVNLKALKNALATIHMPHRAYAWKAMKLNELAGKTIRAAKEISMTLPPEQRSDTYGKN